MIISELLSQKSPADIVTVSRDCTLAEMSTVISGCDIGVLVVRDGDGKPCGIVSERDLARAVALFPGDVGAHTVAEIMTTKIIACEASDEVPETLELMHEHRIRHVLIMERGTLKTVLSIREFNAAYCRLQEQARTDYMTGLTNRRYFMEIFEQEINRRSRFGAPLSVVTVDIDRFKAINDTHGHGIGDRVICDLAGLMTEECRLYDTVGRMGGEEFAILCPNTDLAGATVLCNRILHAVRNHTVETGEHAIGFTVSFGLYESTVPDETSDAILKHADALLYRAKREGRNRIVSDESARPRAALVIEGTTAA